jgi:serine/threonine protein phosphatase 1
MTYVMSDIHGCYSEYLQMLEKINFSDNDTLYILGDVVDRGEDSAELLLDMKMRQNVVPIIGNHDFVAYKVLSKLLVEIADDSFGSLSEKILEDLRLWLKDGGGTTIQSFYRFEKEEWLKLCRYIGEFLLYEVVNINGQNYVLTHMGVPEGATLENLKYFDPYDFLTAEMDYSRTYFDDAILITGHVPTVAINKAYKGKIYREGSNIAIDTGGVYFGTFACLCLDTGEEFYV